MKLHHLRMTGIGPFAGTVEIDFAALGASGLTSTDHSAAIHSSLTTFFDDVLSTIHPSHSTFSSPTSPTPRHTMLVASGRGRTHRCRVPRCV